jgi:hypothetical protein
MKKKLFELRLEQITKANENITKMKKNFENVKYVLYDNEISTLYSIYNSGISVCYVNDSGYEYTDVESDFIIPFDEVKPIYEKVNKTDYINKRKILN